MKHLLLGIALLTAVGAQAQQLETVTVGGQSRTMMVYEPKGLTSNRPLVISLHGANQDAAYQKNQTNWNNCADTAKIVVVYPNAINKFWDTSGQSDIVFISSIIDMMYDRYHIDRNRVYISGFSLGAMMTYHCMEHLGDKVAAFAPVSGVRFDNRAPKAPRRVPFIHTHGTGDDVFKWTGDPGHAAGGYPYIPDYVQKWATYEGLTEKEVISPYPASNPNSIATLTRWTSTDPNDSIEIVLLALKDKGHWHSEDIASGVSTTQEIWRFCRRYTLGPVEPEAPELVSVNPEDRSFDLPLDQRSFTFKFAGPVEIASLKAELRGPGRNTVLTTDATEDTPEMTFIIPDNYDLTEGEYKLVLTGIKNPEGGQPKSLTLSYTYGFTEVGAEMAIETLLGQDWSEMESSIGEGIPYGWKRVNSNADGTNDTRESGEQNTGGARLKYFHIGGDFKSGFYLSARDYQRCDLTYGLYDEYPLHLAPGTYELTFRSTYWSQGSLDNAASFTVDIASSQSPDTKIFTQDVIPTGCRGENTETLVENSSLHSYAVEIDNDGDYLLNFSMTQGWNSVIVADVTLTTYPSSADIYKGGFMRTYAHALELYQQSADVTVLSIINARSRLKKNIDKYANLVSTAPSVYQKAINALLRDMDIIEKYLIQAGVTAVSADRQVVDVQYYSIEGIHLQQPQQGINIVVTRYSDGNSQVTKLRY